VSDGDKPPRGELLFYQVVSMFQLAAMQQMGKIPNPLSNRIERDLDQAKMTVDILSMLKEKTAGNLTRQEQECLGKALFECQMNYLDELKRPAPEAGERGGEGPEGGSGGTQEGESRGPGGGRGDGG